MRIILYVCILALLPLAPLKRLDVAHLQPVQTVALRMEGETLVVETDTRDRGEGKTIREAIRDLESNTPGVIYLDTAEYLLLAAGTEKYISGMQAYMHPGVRVAAWDGAGSVERAAKYLQIRKDLPRLESFRQ